MIEYLGQYIPPVVLHMIVLVTTAVLSAIVGAALERRAWMRGDRER